MGTTRPIRWVDGYSKGGLLNSPESTLFVVRKQRSAAAELETAARVELAGHLGCILTDQEWCAVRMNLLAFVKILRAWDQGARTEEKSGELVPPVETYPKAA